MQHNGIRLIVGLGNPGADYEHTRHNAGAWFVSELANSSHITLRNETKFHGLHGIARLGGHEYHLLIPTTFMNRSGLSVKALSNFYKIPPDAILIAHDELDMPVGGIRLKCDGGAGGHNGLIDIINHLNTRHFYRLRIGIGRPAHSAQVVDYVLKPPRKEERISINTVLDEANKVLPLLLSGQYQKVMNQLHAL
jgi:PTH1 family peptidyl-tRNA hydrolase